MTKPVLAIPDDYPAVLGPDLAAPEQVMPKLAIALLPGWLAGLMIAGATAAMMSTASIVLP